MKKILFILLLLVAGCQSEEQAIPKEGLLELDGSFLNIDCTNTSFDNVTNVRFTIDWSDCCELIPIDELGNALIFPEGLEYGLQFPSFTEDILSRIIEPIFTGTVRVDYELVFQDQEDIDECAVDPECEPFNDWGCFTWVINNPNGLENVTWILEVKLEGNTEYTLVGQGTVTTNDTRISFQINE